MKRLNLTEESTRGFVNQFCFQVQGLFPEPADRIRDFQQITGIAGPGNAPVVLVFAEQYFDHGRVKFELLLLANQSEDLGNHGPVR